MTSYASRISRLSFSCTSGCSHMRWSILASALEVVSVPAVMNVLCARDDSALEMQRKGTIRTRSEQGARYPGACPLPLPSCSLSLRVIDQPKVRLPRRSGNARSKLITSLPSPTFCISSSSRRATAAFFALKIATHPSSILSTRRLVRCTLSIGTRFSRIRRNHAGPRWMR